MAVVTEFTITLDNRPGALADLVEALAGAGININSLQGLPCGGQALFQIVTDEPADTHRVLQDGERQHRQCLRHHGRPGRPRGG